MSNELTKRVADVEQGAADDSAVELPQRAMPQLSLRFLFAVTACSAFVFLVIKFAMAGSAWAQVAILILGTAIATLLAYATAFTIGIRFYDRFGDRTINIAKASSSDVHHAKIVKSVMFVFAILVANEFASRNALADPVVYSSVFPWPKSLEYIVLVGRESHPGSGGYHTVHIKVVPTGTAYTREHRLSFTISTHHDYQRTLAAATTSKLTLPQSGGEVHYPVLVPNFGSESQVRLEIREDGRSVLDEPWVMSQTSFSYQGRNTTIGILDPQSVGAGTSFPDVRSVVTIFGEGQGSLAPISEDASELRLSDANARARASGTQIATVQFRVLEPLPNPANWLSLSDLDVIVVPNEFWTHSSVSPLSHDAMQRWVAAGGVLWSYGDTPTPSTRPESVLDSLQFNQITTAGIPSGKALMSSLRLTEVNHDIMSNSRSSGSAYRQTPGNSSSNRTRQEVLDALTSANNPIAKIENQQDVAGRIQMAEYGLGRVVRLMSPDPFPESLQFWRAVKSVSLDDPVWTAWGDRFGLSYENGSNNYWRWLISEVGGPPVKSFLMLNTLFVVIVGPVACLVLRRHSKLYMLYFLGPVMAMLVSGSLFAYAICSDGLGTKVRVHQWTWLDSANNVVVHQDRSTYYSALGSGELLFPADTLVAVSTPVSNVNHWVRIGTGSYPGGNVEWTDKHQAWSGDFLPSRSQVQYLATQPLIDTDSALTFDASTTGTVRVTNRFKEAVGPLIYRSSAGSYFRIDKINAGDTQPMQASNQQAVVLLLDDQVLPPAGFVPRLSSRGRYGSASDKYPLMEHRLHDWRGQLPKNAFCGLKEVDPPRIAILNAEIKSGLQIVMGQTP